VRATLALTTSMSESSLARQAPNNAHSTSATNSNQVEPDVPTNDASSFPPGGAKNSPQAGVRRSLTCQELGVHTALPLLLWHMELADD